MTQAAGILLLAPGDRGLFLKRGKAKDYPGAWDLPGGTSEGDELPEDTAERETTEEIGFLVEGERDELARTVLDGVDFTTFVQRVSAEFKPSISKEHVGFAWAPITSPPEPLHPGTAIAVARVYADELGVARMIANGQLTSPQKVGAMALYAMRMSGTGLAYRRGIDEHVWRDPEIYLSQNMIDRCAGVPVLMEHPKKNLLDSDEFADRVVGAVMFGYIQGDELWCIARIYDADAIDLMESGQLSTSPAVCFGEPGVNSKVKLEDGKTLLIEGKPSLLDHLAICKQGVWDKGGEPTGVASETRKDSDIMTEEMKADSAKKDADEKEMEKKADAEGGQLDKVLSCLDSMSKRMDAWEEKEKEKEKADAAKADKAKADAEAEEKEKGDPEKIAADKSKKDADEEEKEEKKEKEKADAKADVAKADAARADSEIRAELADTKRRLDEVLQHLPKRTTEADYGDCLAAQSRFDSTFRSLGMRAPVPFSAETLLKYRQRAAEDLKSHSEKWKGINLRGLEEKAFDIAEQQIFSDAEYIARNPVINDEETLVQRIDEDPVTRQRIIKFYGHPRAWMSEFSGSPRRAKFNLKGTH